MPYLGVENSYVYNLFISSKFLTTFKPTISPDVVNEHIMFHSNFLKRKKRVNKITMLTDASNTI